MNVMGALCAFDRAFTALRRQRPQTLRFQDTDSATLGADEARMLCGLAFLQRGNARGAIAVLRASLTCHALSVVVPPLARIAAILDAQGHRMPLWNVAAIAEPARRRAGIARHALLAASRR
jgi:hypothetical protein